VIAAGALATIGALHGAWAAGAAWPFADRTRLAHAIDGVEAEDFPGTVGSAGVSAVLLARGAVGFARPDVLPAGHLPPFARLNATVYSPLCLMLGALAGRAASHD
jgi:hypothetical protein